MTNEECGTQRYKQTFFISMFISYKAILRIIIKKKIIYLLHLVAQKLLE